MWTEGIRAALPRIFRDYDVKTFVDAPCGDWFWMRHVDLDGVDYIGLDISSELVDEIRAEFERPGVAFGHADVTSDPLPKADMLMCRDCLFHLKDWLRWDFYRNFLASGSSHLLSTINHVRENKRLGQNGGFSAFNPMLPPFNLPAPLEMIHETDPNLPADWREVLDAPPATMRRSGGVHRSMGIWSRAQVQQAVDAHDAESA